LKEELAEIHYIVRDR